MRRHAEQDRQASNDREADAKFTKVARGAPDHAELLVALVAAVRLAHRERTAVVADERSLGAIRARELDVGRLAAAIEAILDDDFVVDNARVAHDEPGGVGS